MKLENYFSNSAQEMINADPDGRELFSERVGFFVSAAVTIARQSRPALTVDEWCALADVNNGQAPSYMSGVEYVLSGLWDDVHESAQECDAKWSVDCEALAKRLHAMPLAEQLAAFEIVRKYCITEHEEEAYEKRFMRLGAHPVSF